MIALPQLRAIGRRGIAGLALDLQFASDKSLTPRVGPTPTYSRASGGTYFDSLGVLQTAAINAPRFDHRLEGGVWVSKGLLMEAQRTNIFQRSEEFTNAYWTPNFATVTADQIAAPDGTTTADKIVQNNGTVSVPCVYILASNTSETRTLSAFAKAAEYSKAFLRVGGGVSNVPTAVFDLTGTGSVISTQFGTARIQDCGSGWFRISLTYANSPSQFATNIGPVSNVYTVTNTSIDVTGDGTSGIYIWGAQLEAGDIPSSYIKTVAASATRSGDVCYIIGADFTSLYNATEGTFYAKTQKYYANSQIGRGTRKIVLLDSVPATQSTELSYFPNSDEATIIPNFPTVSVGFQATPPSASGQLVQDAFAYKLDDFAYSRNGAVALTDNSGTLPNALSVMYFGYRPDIETSIFGHILAVQYYSQRLTNTQLQTLTT